MSWIALGFTLDLIGKILIALSVLFVHAKIEKGKHQRRTIVFERELVVIGIILMFLGYVLQISSKFE